MEPRPRKSLDRVRDAIRLKHYSIRTEEAHVDWIKRFIRFHGLRHPSKMGAASTQNQALSALLFLYKEVLHWDLGPVDALCVNKPRCNTWMAFTC